MAEETEQITEDLSVPEEEEEPLDEEDEQKKKDAKEDKKPILTQKDFDLLREQIRIQKGLPLTQVQKKKIPMGQLTAAPKIPVKSNAASDQRYKTTTENKKRPGLYHTLKLLKKRAERATELAEEDVEVAIKDNASSNYRQKVAKGEIIVPQDVRDSFLKYGKPPYKMYVMAHTKPPNGQLQ